ncbi:MAG: hypothetical protein IJA45_05540 [Oscillospiraceae bacterium]|nr:hypothetical protein [Oscillospiraceae bacterium]
MSIIHFPLSISRRSLLEKWQFGDKFALAETGGLLKKLLKNNEPHRTPVRILGKLGKKPGKRKIFWEKSVDKL